MRKELEAAMDDLVGDKGSFAEQEQAITELTRELQQEMTKSRLQRISDGFGERVSVGGKAYKR